MNLYSHLINKEVIQVHEPNKLIDLIDEDDITFFSCH